MKSGQIQLACVLLALAACPSFSQDWGSDYIVMDSTYSMGKVDILGRDRIQFRKSKKDKPIVYSATEVREFNSGGDTYERFQTDGKQVFFERLTYGNIELYHRSGRFALKRGDSLAFFERKNFRRTLNQFISCPHEDASLSKVTYAKASIKNYVKSSNLGECNAQTFPHVKFGVLGGFNYLQFDGELDYSVPAIKQEGAPAISVFVDVPLYRPRALFITTELMWFYSQPLFFTERTNDTYYFGLHVRGLNTLVSAKWMFKQGKLRPYAKGGLWLSYLDFQSPTGLLRTYEAGSSISVTRSELIGSTGLLMGYTAGCGVEIPLSGRKNFHFELRYLGTVRRALEPFETFKLSGLSIMGGFNF